ncbi:hypothetical protein [Vibrio gazogenes]|jgi:hypothetical protein|uniref:Uncharacterized protein n=1 Tax=Vibrio gazogenes DSM 21264 = NBRC 103151 TaxID=1123492 RepID=A0A1M4SUU1_VIBGA|nr:hypothetical protein [Vibrio gazogenes]USP15958.1 hypothetical protein MKS89_16335 [Vibrio gazogenes]SHE35985.1 hypothetical protein SAMN02745781_00167 [Vibrio gazogenes DSM 21264] [Vibrio gazogenes DSM 21264 = NBRC 103151]SJN54782.1 hypothetical protein BQ6471_01203 [Vibrio gazogenes]
MSSMLSSQINITVPKTKMSESVANTAKELAGIFAMFGVTAVITFMLALTWVN